MLALSFFIWWYGQGWSSITASFGRRVRGVLDQFSVAQLAHTLFAPWRQIITTPGASLNARYHALGDNLISRTIGFFVRLFVLIAALISLTLIALSTIIELIVWPLLPLAILVCIIKAVL